MTIDGEAIPICGDVMEILEGFDDNTFDACLCDPPYGLKFMGKQWDHGVPSAVVWREVLRVLKPGGLLMSFGGTRTWHRLTVAIEDAGFEVRDCLMWLYGQGFPKSHDISKAIDKAAGEEREVAGTRKVSRDFRDVGRSSVEQHGIDKIAPGEVSRGREVDITRPATEDAERFSGYGTALKPAWEPVVLAQKPRDGTFANTALEWGCGGLNIDGGRIATTGEENPSIARRETARRTGNTPTHRRPASEAVSEGRIENRQRPETYAADRPSEALGRWPANLLLTHTDECREVGTRKVAGSQGVRGASTRIYGGGKGFTQKTGEVVGYADPDGTETVTAWDCHPSCPVAALDRQTGDCGGRWGDKPSTIPGGGYQGGWRDQRRNPDTYGDTGGASRFFYTAKVSTSERNLGFPDGEKCRHPTLKPIKLTTYLATLLLPPPRTDGEPRRLLVPFSGAGSEMIGGLKAGWGEVIGIEKEEEYVEWSELRIQGAKAEEKGETDDD